MKNLQLENKAVLITGVDKKIGKTVALLLAQQGANIAIIDDNNHNTEETYRMILALGRKSIIFSGDINDYEFCEYTVQQVVSEFGGIDILINGAGAYFHSGNKDEFAEKNKNSYSNIVGMIILSKLVLPYLKRGSSIINTTSTISYLGDHESYLPSKGAVVSFTLSLALNVMSRGINVNVIASNPLMPINTEEVCCQENLNNSLVEREMYLQEIAKRFLFLVTEEALEITGQVFNCNNRSIC